MSGLLPLLPERMSTPSSPPLSAASRLSRRYLLLGFSGPWQRMHEASRIGLMSRAKSTRMPAGGGSFDSSTSAASTEGAHAPTRMADPSANHLPSNLWDARFNKSNRVACWIHEWRSD